MQEKGGQYPYNCIPCTRRQFRCKWVLTTQGMLWPNVAEHFQDECDNFDMYVVVEKEKASNAVQGLIESDLAMPIPSEIDDVIDHLLEVKIDVGVHFIQGCLRYLDNTLRDGGIVSTKRKGICFQILLKLVTKKVRDTRGFDLRARLFVLDEWLKWCFEAKLHKKVQFKEAALLSYNKTLSLSATAAMNNETV